MKFHVTFFCGDWFIPLQIILVDVDEADPAGWTFFSAFQTRAERESHAMGGAQHK